ncbi:hypothetical protein [Spiroplasma endosymbiont of Labia minor]|uniref:hypothetical protein n=1 Tax=Spiroplasma endosymbiont of Labia minor TaxID=3066305 RepID=UPI0030D46CC2
MKKILSALATISIASSMAVSTVACAQRPVASLDDLNNKLGNSNYYDMFKWSTSVISSDIYKQNFIDSFEKNNIEGSGGGVSYLKLVQGVDDKGQYTQYPLVDQIIANYQKTTNTVENVQQSQFTDLDLLSKSISISIFDNNIDTNLAVSNWNGSAWDSTGELSVLKNSETNVYVINFSVSLEPIDGNALVRGARINVTNDIQNSLKDNYYKDVNDEDLANSILKKDDNGNWTTGNYDYRFKVQFYFTLS